MTQGVTYLSTHQRSEGDIAAAAWTDLAARSAQGGKEGGFHGWVGEE